MNTDKKGFILAGVISLVYLAINMLHGGYFSYPVLFFTIVLFFLIVIAQQYFINQDKIPVKKTINQSTTDPKQEITLTQLVDYDKVTGLPSRAVFNDILNKAMNHANRHKKILAILLISFDSNNSDDQLLKEITKRFTKALRTEDVLAKLDDDKFVVLLNDIGKPKFASTVSEKLLTACNEAFIIHSKKIKLKVNIGICIYPDDASSMEDLLNCVNQALSKSKTEGAGHYCFYSKDRDIEAHEYTKLSQLLHSAIKNKEFVLYFQPKLHLKSGNITGIEVLIRWMHPKLGLIYPDKFISIAEETGLIFPIGEWILQEACKLNKFWQDEEYEHMTISINLSPKQFYHPDIAKTIQNALDNAKLEPRYLEIEVSEDIVMNDIDTSTGILEAIKNTGVKISIDHFGTGYISVRHLKNIPIHSVKIDKNFIKGVPAIPNDTAITNAFIMLAHNLGLEVVAEGVETMEQAQYLASQDCDVVQGYFLSEPVAVDKIALHFKKLRETIL